MSYNLVFHKTADQDIQDTIDWYNKQKELLGNRFYSNLKDRLNTISRNPFLWSIRYDNVHCALVNKFPYLIHYIIDENDKKVVVLGILHTSLNPSIWRKRK